MKAFVRGFAYALRGMGLATKGRNMRVHILATAIVISAGLYYRVTGEQWLILVLCIALVISLETVNTAIEATCDLVGAENNLGIDSGIRNIKDLAAGAVLVAAIASAIIALFIFIPYIL